ncbi:MAG: hypothetical protein RIS70_2897 [Planctomycetota bacterium]|jgi:hypothetical protein
MHQKTEKRRYVPQANVKFALSTLLNGLCEYCERLAEDGQRSTRRGVTVRTGDFHVMSQASKRCIGRAIKQACDEPSMR